ncbi:hypothetical protein AQ505_07045 [Pedobacter sp. PACM 27299]|nr:hypothetical protein AQ505_07045 [Pedobacter sp. PACM 27299]
MPNSILRRTFISLIVLFITTSLITVRAQTVQPYLAIIKTNNNVTGEGERISYSSENYDDHSGFVGAHLDLWL